MFWLILGCLLQAFIIPVFICFFRRDFSVEAVIESTIHHTGPIHVLLPVLAVVINSTITQITIAYAIIIIFYLLIAQGFERFWIINWRYFLGVNLASFMAVCSILVIDFGIYINIVILVSFLSITAKILAVSLGLNSYYDYYFLRYVKHSFKSLENKFSSKVTSSRLTESQQNVLWALMIVENANNPKIYRLIEKVIFAWTKQPMTTGIMQVYSAEHLNDNDSIEKASEIVKKNLPKKEKFTKKDINRVGLIYNGENEYCDVLYAVYQNLT